MAGAVSSTRTFSFKALHSQLRQVLIHYLSRPQRWKSLRGDFEPIVVIVYSDTFGVSAEKSIGRWRQDSSIRISEVDLSICPGLHTESTLVHQSMMSSA